MMQTTATPINDELLRATPLPVPHEGSKDDRGRVLIVAGCVEVPGAALLSGTAALRAGAGKLQIATSASVAPAMALIVPEALVIGLQETADGGVDSAAAAERLLPKIKRCDAVLVGPGMMEDEGTRALTAALLADPASLAFVLDAASVCGLQADAAAVRARNGQVVITPHAGEMARLLDRSREDVEADPVGAARIAADLLQAVVVMKGAQTQVVDPQGAVWSYTGGGVGLATSGSGDVLAGLIVGLLARGATPVQAAVWGVYLHGEAGTRLARTQGPVGFLARELATEVPRIMRDVGPG